MFEDDGVQVCCEVDLISKIAIRIWKAGYNHSSSGSHSGSGSGNGTQDGSGSGSSSGSKHSQYIITAVTTLCTAGIHRSKTQNQNSIRNLCGELNENENENNDMLESTFQSTLHTACRDSLIYLETEIVFFQTNRETNTVIMDKNDVNDNINDNNNNEEENLELRASNLSEGGGKEADVTISALNLDSVSVSSIFAIEFIDSSSSNSDVEINAVIDLMKSYLRV